MDFDNPKVYGDTSITDGHVDIAMIATGVLPSALFLRSTGLHR